MFATKGRLKIALFAILAILSIGVTVILVYAAGDPSIRKSDSGVTASKVYWDAFVTNTHYSRSADRTYSNHGYYVENDGTKDVEVDYEFTHRVMKGTAKPIERKERDSVTVYRKNHPRKQNPRSSVRTRNYGENVSHLDGPGYHIDAYTRLTLIQSGKNIVDRTFKIVTPKFRIE